MNDKNNMGYICIEGLSIPCIIGIFDWERAAPQKVLIDLEFPCPSRQAALSDDIKDAVDYKKISKTVISFVEGSRFFLLETLTEKIAELCLSRFEIPSIKIRARKPGALRGADHVGISIERDRSALEADKSHEVFLSIGSNVEPEVYVGQAIRALSAHFALIRQSHVYQTVPQGPKDMPAQDDFWNMVLEARTSVSQDELKAILQKIEKDAGRNHSQDRFEPRTLDIDIISFDGVWAIDSRTNKSFLEKGFVLAPLAEIHPRLKDPETGKMMVELLMERAFRDQPMKCLGPWPPAKANAPDKKWPLESECPPKPK